jgi:hypothetical protein
VEGTNTYKIGFSKNPKIRKSGLQTANPGKLIVTDFYKSHRASQIETIIHNRFQSKKTSEDGEILQGEFFKLDESDVSNFQETCKKIDDTLKFLENNSTLFD